MKPVMAYCLFALAQLDAVQNAELAESSGSQVGEQAQDLTQTAVTTDVGGPDCVYTTPCSSGGWRGSRFLGAVSLRELQRPSVGLSRVSAVREPAEKV
jgi:hypothetical protein